MTEAETIAYIVTSGAVAIVFMVLLYKLMNE